MDPVEPGQQYRETGLLDDGTHSDSHVPSTLDRIKVALRVMPAEMTESNMIVMDQTKDISPL
jgi:hypothetical protein